MCASESGKPTPLEKEGLAPLIYPRAGLHLEKEGVPRPLWGSVDVVVVVVRLGRGGPVWWSPMSCLLLCSACVKMLILLITACVVTALFEAWLSSLC